MYYTEFKGVLYYDLYSICIFGVSNLRYFFMSALESEPEARGTWYLTPNYQNICTTVALQNTFKSPIVFAAKSKSWSTLYVRIPLKMLDKKFIKDFNCKFNWQLSENGRISFEYILSRPNGQTAKPPILWPSEKVQPYKPTWGSDLIFSSFK